MWYNKNKNQRPSCEGITPDTTHMLTFHVSFLHHYTSIQYSGWIISISKLDLHFECFQPLFEFGKRNNKPCLQMLTAGRSFSEVLCSLFLPVSSHPTFSNHGDEDRRWKRRDILGAAHRGSKECRFLYARSIKTSKRCRVNSCPCDHPGRKDIWTLTPVFYFSVVLRISFYPPWPTSYGFPVGYSWKNPR